jgi:hypothetical protein
MAFYFSSLATIFFSSNDADGCAIAQAVNCWLPTVAARVRSEIKSCGIRAKESDTGSISSANPHST